jgi:hypothetical protein
VQWIEGFHRLELVGRQEALTKRRLAEVDHGLLEQLDRSGVAPGIRLNTLRDATDVW